MAVPLVHQKTVWKKEHTLNTRCEPLSFAHFLPLLMSVSITPVKNSFHETIQMPSIPQPRIACCLMVVTCSSKMKDRDSRSTNGKESKNELYPYLVAVAERAGPQQPLWRKAVMSTSFFLPQERTPGVYAGWCLFGVWCEMQMSQGG